MSVIAQELAERIIKAVRKDIEQRLLYGDHVSRLEIGRLLLTKRHCGQRMLQVKVFYTDGACEEHPHEWRGADEHVCPCCLYHYGDI